MASEYLKWKFRDVKPDVQTPRTPKQKIANWWQYHKWWLLVGAALLIALIDIGRNALGIGVVKPDYQMAYVASVPLNDAVVAALQDALTQWGEDCNGDGRVTFAIHSYVDMATAQDSDAARYAAAAKIKLMADMEGCESYFFLCDDPEALHANYEILARSDGGIAEASDAIDCHAWEACPILRGLEVDSSALNGLFFARRGFWQDHTCKYRPQCDALWEKLTEGAES